MIPRIKSDVMLYGGLWKTVHVSQVRRPYENLVLLCVYASLCFMGCLETD
jgi:hypothetical protein